MEVLDCEDGADGVNGDAEPPTIFSASFFNASGVVPNIEQIALACIVFPYRLNISFINALSIPICRATDDAPESVSGVPCMISRAF